MKARLNELLNKWKSEEITKYSDLYFDDGFYKFYVYNFINSGLPSFKTSIVNRLETMLKFLDADQNDYINESIVMWTELSKRGCDKRELSQDDYPLSQYNNRTSCALCIYAEGVSRTTDICDSCPIKWEDGVCDYKYQRWHNASSKSDRKMYAKTILKEIKENRKNK